MESHLVHGCHGNVLHLLLVPPLPEQGVDSGAVLHQPDVQFANQGCKVVGRVLGEPVFGWSRQRDRTLWMFRMTVVRPLGQLLHSTSMRDWLREDDLRP